MSMKTVAISFFIVLSGCTTTARMDLHGLKNYQTDCSKKYEQIQFLQSQLPSSDEQILNGLYLMSVGGFLATINDGTYLERKQMQDGYHRTAILTKIDQIKSSCP